MRSLIFSLFVFSLPLFAGDFDPEVAAAKAIRVADFNLSSFEDARKKIPKMIQVRNLLFPKKVIYEIPKAARKDPSGEGVKYYEKWGGQVILTPIDTFREGGKFDGKTFYYVTPTGIGLKGNLPHPLEQGEGIWENYIRFTDPASLEPIFLNLKQERKGPELTLFAEAGEMEPLVGKYEEIKMEPVKPQDIRKIIHFKFGEDLSALARLHYDADAYGPRTKEALRFAYVPCKALNPKLSKQLEIGLADIDKVVP
jgi:hypothetical protein